MIYSGLALGPTRQRIVNSLNCRLAESVQNRSDRSENEEAGFISQIDSSLT